MWTPGSIKWYQYVFSFIYPNLFHLIWKIKTNKCQLVIWLSLLNDNFEWNFSRHAHQFETNRLTIHNRLTMWIVEISLEMPNSYVNVVIRLFSWSVFTLKFIRTKMLLFQSNDYTTANYLQKHNNQFQFGGLEFKWKDWK